MDFCNLNRFKRYANLMTLFCAPAKAQQYLFIGIMLNKRRL